MCIIFTITVHIVIQVIVVVMVTAVLDIVQLGLYFPMYQSYHGRGQSE